MANMSFASDVTQFYNNFSSEELQVYQSPTWNGSILNGSIMFSNMLPTPSPSGSSLSGPFSPSHSEEGFSQGRPFLRIVEQPVSKFRFRYRSEMQGAHGSLLGRGDTSKKRTYPTVQLVNYDGEDAITIRCLLYTAKEPLKHHMHQLIAKENSKEILDHEITVSERNDFRAEFKGLGIVHMSKKDLKKELVRKKEKMYMEQLRRDRELAHLEDATLKDALKKKIPELEKEAAKEAVDMDPNKVKLCFQAFYRGPLQEVNYVCEDVFSDTIENLKSAETGELKICRIDRCAGTCEGGDEVYILVEKVCKKNIRVRFFELDDQDQVLWEDFGQFSEFDVHHQYAIVFRTPVYRRTDIQENVQVKIELVRPKDKAKSDPMSFTYKPTRRHGKRALRTSSSYDSWSSFEGPKKSRQPGITTDDDPMLSGSDSSRLSSWNLPSDAVQEAITNLTSNDPLELVQEFENFLNSNEFSGYSESFQDALGPKPEFQGPKLTFQGPRTEEFEDTPYIQSPKDLETFVDLNLGSVSPVLFGSGWQVDSAPTKDKNKHGENDNSVVTDGCVRKDAAKKETATKLEPVKTKVVRESTNLEHLKTKQDDSMNLAKKAYAKLLKLMKSRHPSRLQDMKNIIRAEDQDFGPLHAAVLHGQLKELSDLLSLIIKSNQLKLINSTNRRKQTPLMVAVEENSLDCLKLLCMAKADLNHADYKENTALHLAAQNKHSICLGILLAVQSVKGSNTKIELDSKNEKGETALHIAIRQKDLECVKLLVAAGADLNAKTGTAGQTPLHLAVEFNCKDIVDHLFSQEKINPNEVNFNGKTAQQLVHSSQRDIMALFEESSEGYSKSKVDEEGAAAEDDEDEDEDDDDDEDMDFDDENDDDDDDNESEEMVSKENQKTPDKFQDSEQDEFGLLDQVTLDTLVENLDKDKNWKAVCQKLNCSFLAGTFSNVASPARCLITFLEFEKKVTLSEFRSILDELNVPNAVKALDGVLAKKSMKMK